ncbi:hypothetical protein FACS1894109_20200 [Spirochaetia bacterium]|nr:hypothetical protein FACS1894109_20200 [Spirochaetia bacterium]
MTFWSLIEEYDIQIPGIQRDYAQGRKSEQAIGRRFIKDIYEKISKGNGLNLDFVYGKNGNNSIIPLDGQQRLTTLFLLHWFLSIGIIDDAQKKILSKFTYETRRSSEDFCNYLVNQGYEYNSKTPLSVNIQKTKWYFLSWNKDPTIKAMLNMLDIIQEIFQRPNKELFDALIKKEKPLITFDFLPLDDFNLSDELYIKMNARGKPLTSFENFKARFSELIGLERSIKLDNAWLDIFWNLEKGRSTNISTENVDKMFINFFYYVTYNFYVERNDLEKDFDIFMEYEEIYSDEKFRSMIEKILDSLIVARESYDYFKDFLFQIRYIDRAIFYSVTKFFKYCDLSLSLKTFLQLSVFALNERSKLQKARLPTESTKKLPNVNNAR